MLPERELCWPLLIVPHEIWDEATNHVDEETGEPRWATKSELLSVGLRPLPRTADGHVPVRCLVLDHSGTWERWKAHLVGPSGWTLYQLATAPGVRVIGGHRPHHAFELIPDDVRPHVLRCRVLRLRDGRPLRSELHEERAPRGRGKRVPCPPRARCPHTGRPLCDTPDVIEAARARQRRRQDCLDRGEPDEGEIEERTVPEALVGDGDVIVETDVRPAGGFTGRGLA